MVEALVVEELHVEADAPVASGVWPAGEHSLSQWSCGRPSLSRLTGTITSPR